MLYSLLGSQDLHLGILIFAVEQDTVMDFASKDKRYFYLFDR